MTSRPPPVPLFQTSLNVISAGVSDFAEDLRRQSVPVIDLAWRPPAGGSVELAGILSRLYVDPRLAARIEAANQEVLRRILAANPQVVDVAPAREAMGLPDYTVLHAGPPIAWEQMCGPQKRAVLGAIQYEGWAQSPQAAAALVSRGAVNLLPNHIYNAVGPMTGVTSPSMPVLAVRNQAFGNFSFSTFNEGRGNTLWFGVCDQGTLERLRWIRDELGPAMRATIRHHGPFNIFDINAQGLQMGDECHARHAACTALLVKRLVPHMLEGGVDGRVVAEVVRFADNNNHFFLNFTMAAVKATMDAAHDVPYSTVVTGLSRNGVHFMLRVAGLGQRWIVGPVSPMAEAVYYTGYSVADAAGDIGDSAIIETCGLGGMAMAGAPSMAPFVGGRLADEVAALETLAEITVGRHPKFSLPAADNAQTPLGIDLRRVVETRIVPFITTGVLHESSPTVGQIGTGVARAPVAIFDQALVELAHEWGVPTSLPRPTNFVDLKPALLPAH
jgi:hypothetical protein